MALQLAGESALVTQGVDNQGWIREISVQDAQPGLKVNQKGTGRGFDFQDGGVSKMYLPDGGNVTIAGSLVFDLANDVTVAPTSPAAPRTLTIPDPGANDAFAFLAATQTLTNKTLSGGGIDGAAIGSTARAAGAFSTLAVGKAKEETSLGAEIQGGVWIRGGVGDPGTPLTAGVIIGYDTTNDFGWIRSIYPNISEKELQLLGSRVTCVPTFRVGTIDTAAGDLTLNPAGKIALATGKLITGWSTQTTVGAAGAAGALPANPTGYAKIDVGGTTYVTPYYAAA